MKEKHKQTKQTNKQINKQTNKQTIKQSGVYRRKARADVRDEPMQVQQ